MRQVVAEPSASAANTDREISIRRSMMSNMLLVVVLLSIAVMLATLFGAAGIAKSLARTLIGQTIQRTEAHVRQFIAPVEDALGLTRRWIAAGLVSPADGSGARELLLPLLQELDALYGAIVVDPQGRTLHLNRDDADWRLRLLDPADPGTAQVVKPFGDPAAQWRREPEALDVPSRPWYRQATQADLDEPTWTQAYRFFDDGRPGLTATLRTTGPKGGEWIAGFDVLLEDISEFSRHFTVGHRGMILITDGNGQIIGLPNLARFEAPSVRRSAYLKHPGALGFTLATDAAKAFQPEPDGAVRLEPVRFRSDGTTWWGQGKWIPLDRNTQWWVGVLVPESELLGTLMKLGLMLIIVTILGTAVAVTRAVVLARRYAQPIGALAQQSIRISEGELDQPAEIRSRLRELTRLAEAHERMRLGLISLLKLEDDLQLARQIQQKTFPASFPRTEPFDIAAGSRPADATGGDTYDVVGIRYHGEQIVVSDDRPDRIYLLLADATGHGLGPALTASQVRAMFRMGVRLGRIPSEIACQMNAQLRADAHGGRFVTAWTAMIDVERLRIQMLSAGQAPLLIYRREQDRMETLSADNPPLGILESSGNPPLNEVELAPGDILAVISDGAIEARSPSEERFGTGRVEAVLRNMREASAAEILAALKEALDAFLRNHPPEDDQTAIIVKRK